MRGLRSTIALIVVLAALGGYIYYLNRKPADEPANKKTKVFASIQADKIDELQIATDAGEKTIVRKGEGGWQVVAPIEAKADESEIASVTSNLASADVQRVIDENPPELKDYGLAAPRVDVAFKLAGDKDFRHLLLGEKTPTGADVFAKRAADKPVFAIAAYLENTFNRSTFDLREKTLLKFDRDKIDSIDVTSNGKTVQLTKVGGAWNLTRPLKAPSDFGTAEGLIGRLQTVQMKSIVTNDAAPADLKKYGLDKPQETVTLNMGSARATLELGDKAGENAVYARDVSRPAVMTVESALADDLKKGPDDYRRKDIFEFRAYNATHIEITRGGQTFVFDKVKGEGADAQDKWRRVSPTPADANKDSLDSLLTRLANLRAASFVDSTANTGLNAPAATVTVKFGDGGSKDEKVTFGRTGNDVFAARASEPGAAKIDTTDFEQAMKALDEVAK